MVMDTKGNHNVCRVGKIKMLKKLKQQKKSKEIDVVLQTIKKQQNDNLTILLTGAFIKSGFAFF